MSLELLGLVGVLLMVLCLPFTVRWVEEELEFFLLAMGVLAVSFSGQWSAALVGSALLEPVGLAAAVLVAGLLFRRYRGAWRRVVAGLQRRVGAGAVAAILVVLLGALSSLVTAVVAALLLAEAVDALRLPRARELRLVVLACFAIGAGSALSPLGGPLASIAVSRLRAAPYHADGFFLVRVLGPFAGALIGALAALAWALCRGPWDGRGGLHEEGSESQASVLNRSMKAYLFVAGLVLLGQGFAPLVLRWVLALPVSRLYWVNLASAVLDNATLVAAELSPQLPLEKIRALLMGLIISGGMLVPGNIPNMICASKLRIRSREWASVGLPLGLALMGLVAALLFTF